MIQRSGMVFLVISLWAMYALPAVGQGGAQAIENYFTGKEVTLKIDMPGTQKGVDLKFENNPPMNWKEYGSRIKQFGAAIRKGDKSRVTSVVVKKDMIEIQLDGGGFGTFGDDTNTKVEAKKIEPSDYEKQLAKAISETTDEDKKRDLERDLDRERARRDKQNAANERAAQVASEIKAQQVQGNRMNGGSRFNLRWKGSIPEGELTPESIVNLLGEHVDFSELQGGGEGRPEPTVQKRSATELPSAGGQAADGSPTGKLKRGMQISEVSNLLGPGRQLSESTTPEGWKTQVFEYLPGDRRVEVTYVDGLVMRYSISSK